MVITEVRGELLSAGLPAVAHGCNCSGTMGAGVAKEIRRRWPPLYRLYRSACRTGGFLPGDVLVWPGPPVVYNLAVQLRPGPSASLAAIEVAVARMLDLAEAEGITEIGMPRIGCGPGGLRWSEVGPVLDDLAAASAVDLVVFEKP
jgi:O-acetyl-ADP-ribose deacetylase (regulator of RNase III)